MDPKMAFPRAKEAALKALEIDGTLAEAHSTLGWIKNSYDWDWSGAEKEFQRSIELNPSYSLAHYRYGMALAQMGRLGEAITEEKRALELDPLSVVINWALGHVFYLGRQYDLAIEQERKTLEELDSNFMLAYYDLGAAYVQKSMYKDGIPQLKKALAISPNNTQSISLLGWADAVDAVGNRRAEAQKLLLQLNELSSQEDVQAYSKARIYTGLGERDKAIEWLQKGYDDRSILFIKVNPEVDSLRSDRRFQDLLRRMNLQP
jgi:adenylate cyclase